MADIIVKNINEEQKRKAVFILNSKGKTLSDAVREMVEKYSKEYEKNNK